METYVVADIGGTQIRTAVFQAGNPIPLRIKKIRTRDKVQTPIERMIGLFKEIWPTETNVAALGEWRYGAGKGHDNLLYLTISTGIGGGAIVNGKLLVGHRGLAGEFGHITIVPNGPLCGCGHRGHLEAVASGTAIAKYVAERISLGAESSLVGIANPSAADVS